MKYRYRAGIHNSRISHYAAGTADDMADVLKAIALNISKCVADGRPIKMEISIIPEK